MEDDQKKELHKRIWPDFFFSPLRENLPSEFSDALGVVTQGSWTHSFGYRLRASFVGVKEK